MKSKVEKLVSLGSAPLMGGVDPQEREDLQAACFLPLLQMLNLKNGFLAFEGALLVRPLTNSCGVFGVLEWNAHNWRKSYDLITDSMIFFASDIFSCQFAIAPTGIISFNPESGEVKQIAGSVEGWAKEVLDNYSYLTGWNVAHDWQIINGPIALGKRLLPRKPFVLGGDYVVDNLVAADELLCMEKYGLLFEAIKDLADGESVTIEDWLDN